MKDTTTKSSYKVPSSKLKDYKEILKKKGITGKKQTIKKLYKNIPFYEEIDMTYLAEFVGSLNFLLGGYAYISIIKKVSKSRLYLTHSVDNISI